MGMADLLLETPLDEEQREYVQATRLCAENLFEVLNAALEYSSLEAGRFSLEESEFSLKETLDAALDQHLPRAQAKGSKAVFELETGPPETMGRGCPRFGRELLGHLVANGIKFTHVGSVELRAFIDRTANQGSWAGRGGSGHGDRDSIGPAGDDFRIVPAGGKRLVAELPGAGGWGRPWRGSSPRRLKGGSRSEHSGQRVDVGRSGCRCGCRGRTRGRTRCPVGRIAAVDPGGGR